MLIDTIPRRQRTDQTIDGAFVQNSSGILMMYDNNRSKWLSVSRDSIKFGIGNNNITSNRWLMVDDVWSNLQGYDINRNITITLITAQSRNNSNCKFRITNGSGDLHLIELNNESKKINDGVNINVAMNDSIQVFLEVNENKIDYPSLLIEYAWS